MELTAAKLKVCIVEDNKNFREGLEVLLNASERFNCTAVFHSAEDAIQQMPDCDLILLDINLPGVSGIESIPFFKHRLPHTRIIMLTVLEDDDAVFSALLAGADGYLLKKTKPALIPEYLSDAVEGGSPMHPAIASRVIEYFRNEKKQPTEYALTPREADILNLLVQGHSNRAIASQLFISYETVRIHMKHIFNKLSVNSRAQAISKILGKTIR